MELDASEYYLPFPPADPLCGSRGLPPCLDGTFCSFLPQSECGRADRPGVCLERPAVCPQQFDPVCGCDNQTYGNACEAAAASVSVEHDGPCEVEPRLCGTIRGLTCEPGKFCDVGVGQCLVADATGVCRPLPEVCFDIFAPVRGCDDRTHGNAYLAAQAGMQIDFLGSCR